jgi:hypothetical protein
MVETLFETKCGCEFFFFRGSEQSGRQLQLHVERFKRSATSQQAFVS